MAKVRTPRTLKPKAEKKVLQMPDNANGNGNAVHAPVDMESEIRLRAYQLFEQRGCTHGQDAEDWFAAEREVLARYAEQKHTA
jgi:hypothetical protein